MSQAVTLWFPQLLAADQRVLAEAGWFKQLPVLRTLLAKADVYPLKPHDYYERASHLFHQSQTLAAAPAKAAVELVDFDENVFWLCVDPVHLVADRDTLVLIPPQDLAISADEAQALVASFNQHFAQDGVQLEIGTSKSWFMRIKQPVDIQTTALEMVAYQSLQNRFPQGHAGAYWRKLMNETQMLFYTHPVNIARRERGVLEVNSVWVWGEGQIKLANLQMRPQAKIFAEQSYLKGLAQFTQAGYEAIPSNFQAWCSQRLAAQAHFIAFNPANFDDGVSFMQALQMLETNWLAPVLADVKAGRIHSLFIDLGLEQGYLLEPSHLKRFWRWRNPLKSL